MPPLDKVHQLERRARTIVESLGGTWRQNKGMCCCPAHDDRTPSLSVTLGRKAILFHCFAGCSNEEVIAALDRQGVRSRDLFDGSGAVAADRPEKSAFNSNARRLWHSATAISDSPAEGYLA
ncbi:CHC2 zinc finger domain-containing protein, partial [Novosphingobium sediminis]